MNTFQETINNYTYTTFWIFLGITLFFILIGNYYLCVKVNSIWTIICCILWSILVITLLLYSYVIFIDGMNKWLVIVYYLAMMFLCILWTYEYTYGETNSYSFKYFILVLIVVISLALLFYFDTLSLFYVCITIFESILVLILLVLYC